MIFYYWAMSTFDGDLVFVFGTRIPCIYTLNVSASQIESYHFLEGMIPGPGLKILVYFSTGRIFNRQVSAY